METQNKMMTQEDKNLIDEVNEMLKNIMDDYDE